MFNYLKWMTTKDYMLKLRMQIEYNRYELKKIKLMENLIRAKLNIISVEDTQGIDELVMQAEYLKYAKAQLEISLNLLEYEL